MNSRRKFIQTGCAACLGLVASHVFLDACAAGFPIVRARADGNVIRVAESAFRSPSDMLVVRSDAIESDILLRKDGGRYLALYLLCTHGDVGLTASGRKIYCSAHGSVFDLDGRVVKEPARKPLRKFGTTVRNGEIAIHLT